jgi:UDP-N-acetylglucosamine acyltransferase
MKNNASSIHPTALVEEGAVLGERVKLGPYCVIGPEVTLGDDVEVMSHAVVDGFTALGSGCTVHPFARVGGQTQDLKFKGGRPGVRIGERTVIREYVTVHAATHDGEFTEVGSDCLLMAYVHIAHCCKVGNQVIMANCSQLAGHVQVEDQVTIEGMVGVVQFLRLGRLSFIGGTSKVTKDIPPFMIANGNPAEVRGFNRIGMERRGLDEAARRQIKEAYRVLYRKRELSLAEALAELKAGDPLADTEHLIRFIESSERGIAR